MQQDYWDPGYDRDALIAVALGEQAADLVVRGGRLVDVHTGEIYAADVAVANSRIAAVGDVARCVGDATVVVEADGRYVVPGLIDTHIHIGASGLTMTQLARVLVPHGTAAIVTDFYEPAAQTGVGAMRFMLDETARTPLKALFSPFCPPFGDANDQGGVTAEEFADVLEWPETLEVREWYLERERGHPAELAAGARARQLGKRLSGHLPPMPADLLQASVAAGIHSDHEARTAAQAIERVRLGVAMQIRCGSARRDELAVILRALTEQRIDPRLFMFSTDEADVDDLADLGHIDHRVRVAIGTGVDAVDAIRMGSLNAATFLGITGDLGSIAPGRLAFVNLVDDLAGFNVSTVVAGARVVGEDGRWAGEPAAAVGYPPAFRDTVRLERALRPDDFVIPAPPDRTTVTARVLSTPAGRLELSERELALPVVDGALALAGDVVKVAAIERHHATGKMGLGLLEGFGLERGAFGSAFQPVTMNIAVLGTNDADMAVVANRIAELGGGYVAALDGEVIAEVALPVLGYLSDAPADEVVAAFRAVRDAIAEQLGCRVPGLYTTHGIPLVPVGPGLHVVAEGLIRLDYDTGAERRTELSLLVD